ncbi:hypothetical protein P7D85_02660 [Enterococcus hulanensis]|uniref:Uncharacterized protein n=1 Tax=Enterococcus hulanensis TaxID=2559929 RepID=A0ABU3EUW7_9ENTE|nr:hypothetical protein [Enterococcus hulanensis]MDT2598657.1 hypothetical protein [Enterococcus hulanensis]MDT2607838.1 hypothetical protein [Enterococcus hulanensis]MDT2615133.1 hypothetical protein [Enterococcus hulanensis]MDT2626896.1 hypothetical protein [Enterococcus hulanensis]MDT2654205.1 hypothetical protein [Enterococcus hulanensis]
MNEQTFTAKKLFSLKKKTLEKRIYDFYNLSKDTDSTVQYLVALQVRERLGDSEFHLILKELVQHLFSQRKVTKIIKKFFFYFKHYFTSKEWKYLNLRVFPVRQYAEKAINAVGSRFSISNLFGAQEAQVE